MRLRNIPRAAGVLEGHPAVVKSPSQYRGHFKELFGDDRPIYVEIGMGKGRFILNMAGNNPDVNFIGIERYSSVLLRAVEKFDTEEYKGLKNVRFICMDAADIEQVFARGEVAGIYLNFSDPWPKARHARRRLTSKEYLARYANILSSGGKVEFKTDNAQLFEFSLEEAGEAGWKIGFCTRDLYGCGDPSGKNVATEYEEKFASKGNPIKKACIFPPAVI